MWLFCLETFDQESLEDFEQRKGTRLNYRMRATVGKAKRELRIL
jgi:hypothetical protein